MLKIAVSCQVVIELAYAGFIAEPSPAASRDLTSRFPERRFLAGLPARLAALRFSEGELKPVTSSAIARPDSAQNLLCTS